MNKAELVAKIAKNASTSKVAVEVILDEAVNAITESLKTCYDRRPQSAHRHQD